MTFRLMSLLDPDRNASLEGNLFGSGTRKPGAIQRDLLSRGGRSTLAAHYLERSQAFWSVND
jgi:hypothetical protein